MHESRRNLLAVTSTTSGMFNKRLSPLLLSRGAFGNRPATAALRSSQAARGSGAGEPRRASGCRAANAPARSGAANASLTTGLLRGDPVADHDRHRNLELSRRSALRARHWHLAARD